MQEVQLTSGNCGRRVMGEKDHEMVNTHACIFGGLGAVLCNKGDKIGTQTAK
jgi:hypothetical protein